MMNMLKKIWNDPVGSKVISTVIISIGVIIYSLVKSKLDELYFGETLLKTLISPYFLGLVILFLFSYILFDKLKKQKKNVIKTTNTDILIDIDNSKQARQKPLEWSDIERYVNVIVQKIHNEGFTPTCIFAASIGSNIIASMIAQRLVREPDTSIPFFFGMLIRRKKTDDVIIREGYDVIEVTKFGCLLIQKDLPVNDSDKILFVRDHSGTGLGFYNLIKYFSKKNVKEDNMRTACIAYDMERYNVPNYSCFNANNIWFPWGKNI